MVAAERKALLACAFVGPLLHAAASCRWLVIYLTYGNRKGIPLDPDKVVLAYVLPALLAGIPWLSRSVRRKHTKALVAATVLNLLAFVFAACLLHAGIIRILRY